MAVRMSKVERQKLLKEKINTNPFYTDDELAEMFGVSVQTIRLDRMELGIPEVRERIKSVAEENYQKVRTITGTEVVGELIDLELGKRGISIFEPTEDMVFVKTKIVKGQYIYSQAESLAMSLIDASAALIGVANIKYKFPVKVGDRLVAKAEVIRQRGNKYFVWVKIKVRDKEVFRGKFILVAIDEDFLKKGVTPLRLAIDAMGGDHAPEEIIKGSLEALKHFQDVEIVLIGKEEVLRGLQGKEKRLKLVFASEVIENDEAPVTAVRKKKYSSMVVGLELLKKEEVDAFLSAGNTGALMAGALLTLGRIKGIDRPALAPILPTLNGATVLLDAGSNTNCDAQNLVQFAVMGHVYAQKMFEIERPRVGLFNIGAEEEKGNEVVKKAFEELKKSKLNFIGNVEGRDIPYGVCEVVVCDGFVGNAILKSMEGIASVISQLLKEELKRNIFTKLGALLIMGGLKRITKKMDYTEYGGAPLLGIKKPVIKAHGNSKAKAIFNAIKQAKNFVDNDVLNHIKEEIESMGDELSV